MTADAGRSGWIVSNLGMVLATLLSANAIAQPPAKPQNPGEHAMRDSLPTPDEIAKLPPDGGPEFNRLIFTKSPYLLQHARNPVDWYPWGKEAFEKARKEDKPIFLSVGYSTCHWCHVMERESFERDDVAQIMNKHYVSIKVDREERPDVDEIYMNVTQVMTGRGGWPNSVWLTPDGRPWYAGTYFPREDAGRRPGFKSILGGLADAWRNHRKEIEERAKKISNAVKQTGGSQAVEPAGELSRDIVQAAVREMRNSFDARQGGFGGAPKFPPHGGLRLLLDEYRRTRDASVLDMATRTLEAMALGGIHDHVGGGFHRYATDARWFLPHFEKMLYDNAQFGRAYVEAFHITGDTFFSDAARDTLDWTLREMTDEKGGFYSAIDADSEGEEGKFYVWTREEIRQVLGKDTGELFCEIYGVEEGGNFEDEATGRKPGTNILFLRKRLTEIAEEKGMDAEGLSGRMADARSKLLERRSKRIRPHLDDKVLAAWNGLMIGSLAYGGKHLDEPRYTAAAEKAAAFVLGEMRDGKRLLRSYRAGQAKLNAYLDDYAFVADGLLELHEATGDDRWLQEARGLIDMLLESFADPAGGFYFTSADHEQLLVRSKAPFDRAIPSGNGVATKALAQLGRETGERKYLEAAEKTLLTYGGFMRQQPRGTQSLILALTKFLESSESKDSTSPADARATKHPVTIELFASALKTTPKTALPMALRIGVAKGWHINSAKPLQDYLKPTAVALKKNEDARLAGIEFPEGRNRKFAFSPEDLSVYEGTVWIPLTLEVTAAKPPRRLKLEFQVQTQACHDTACLAPETHALPLEIDLRAGQDEATSPRHPQIFETLKPQME